MGLMDKVKAQAAQIAEKSKEAIDQGQSKLGDMQAKKATDGWLRDLGAYYYLRDRGRGGPDTDTRMQVLVAQLTAHEAEHGPIELSLAQTAAEQGVPTATTVGSSDTVTSPAPAAARPAVALGGRDPHRQCRRRPPGQRGRDPVGERRRRPRPVGPSGEQVPQAAAGDGGGLAQIGQAVGRLDRAQDPGLVDGDGRARSAAMSAFTTIVAMWPP